MVRDIKNASVTLNSDITQIKAQGAFDNKDVNGYVPNLNSHALRVDVPKFDGPLDLLLFLIKKHSMDIFDIPILQITQAYNETLSAMQELDLDIGGEFLIMAATLAEIKSRLLLPQKEKNTSSNSEEEELDPRADLVKRLLAYRRYKQLAERLASLPQLDRDFFVPGSNEVPTVLMRQLDIQQPQELLDAFVRALTALKNTPLHRVKIEEIDLKSRISALFSFYEQKNTADFLDLVRHFGLMNLDNLVTTFLALLHLCKMGLIQVQQDDVGMIHTKKLDKKYEN